MSNHFMAIYSYLIDINGFYDEIGDNLSGETPTAWINTYGMNRPLYHDEPAPHLFFSPMNYHHQIIKYLQISPLSPGHTIS
jgi:hypothetical protein